MASAIADITRMFIGMPVLQRGPVNYVLATGALLSRLLVAR